MPKGNEQMQDWAEVLAGEQMNGIDSNIRNLVSILNTFEGIFTMSSCGGHKNPIGSQVLENKFYVGFDITNSNGYPSKSGWKSIGKIDQALSTYIADSDNTCKLEILFCNLSPEEDDPEGLCNSFEIRGENVDIHKLEMILFERLNK